MANKPMERWAASLAFRDVQTKTTVRYRYTVESTEWLGRSGDRPGRGRCGDAKSLLHGWWERSSHAGKELVVSYKTKHLHSYQGNEDVCSHKTLSKTIYSGFIHNHPKQKQPRCPSAGAWLNRAWPGHTWNTTQQGKGMADDTRDKLRGSSGGCAEWISKAHMLPDSISTPLVE